MKTRVTVELSVNEEFFRSWLGNHDEEPDDLVAALIDHFKEHLHYNVTMTENYPFSAGVVE